MHQRGSWREAGALTRFVNVRRVLLVAVAALTVSLIGATATHGEPGDRGPDGWAHAGEEAPTLSSLQAAVPDGYPVTGIDVSHHQHVVDWDKVARGGAKFSYAKATEGTHYVDDRFTANNRGAKRNGIYAGAYHYARPDGRGGRTQADYFLDRAQYANDGRTLPPMLDIEWPYRWNGKYVAKYPCYGKSPNEMVRWIRDFVDRVKERTGSRTMIYTNPNWWNPCTGRSGAFGDNYLFVANYTGRVSKMPAGWQRWTLWQYANHGDLPGDQDVFNGSLSALARLATNPAGPVPHPVVGDWDGNGTLTPGVAVAENGRWRWWLSNKLDGSAASISFTYGDSAKTPIVGDWDGNGTYTPGTVDMDGDHRDWYLSNTLKGGPPDVRVAYGGISKEPVVGDWDGNGTFTPGTVDMDGRRHDWYLSNTFKGGSPDISVGYGDIDKTPIVGDWDGNGTFTPGVVDMRGDRHDWYLANSFAHPANDVRFGYGDIYTSHIVGDWDGNGTFTPGVVDVTATGHQWRLSNTHTGGAPEITFTFGDPGSKP